MLNVLRQVDSKIDRLKKYCDIKRYSSFYELNKFYEFGVIYAGLNTETKYALREDFREKAINFNLIEFAKNKYRSYEEISKLDIPVLKSILTYNPLNWCFENDRDVLENFGNEKFVIKPNNDGMGNRIFLTDYSNWKDLAKSKMLQDDYILVQEYIKEDYDDLRIVIMEPVGTVDYFGRLPANIIFQKRNYSERKELKLTNKILDYVEIIRTYINKTYNSPYMFYSIDFYLIGEKVIFGEINSNIGMCLLSEDCIKKFAKEFGG